MRGLCGPSTQVKTTFMGLDQSGPRWRARPQAAITSATRAGLDIPFQSIFLHVGTARSCQNQSKKGESKKLLPENLVFCRARRTSRSHRVSYRGAFCHVNWATFFASLSRKPLHQRSRPKEMQPWRVDAPNHNCKNTLQQPSCVCEFLSLLLFPSIALP